jgi:uncharacterized protein (TIGR03086 family)
LTCRRVGSEERPIIASASELYLQSCDVFDVRVRAVRDDEWTAPTPCTEWSVRDLVNHVVGEDLWLPPLLIGKTVADVGDAFSGDQLGDDPVSAWSNAVDRARVAAADPGVEARTVHLSYGEESASEYLMQMFADHLIHAWDLASAIGRCTELPADLVDACADWFADQEDAYRSGGAVGERVPVAPDAGAQARLLAAFGRVSG